MSHTQRPVVYGPVPSRRLGLSLGLDLVVPKTCCFDCLYCQVGRTTCHTQDLQGSLPAPPEEVVRQVLEAVDRGPRPEVITLAGSGEPTLYGPLEELARGLKGALDLPLVLITNSGLLHREQVARAALLMDRVYPSLDAPDEATFRRVNRPAAGLTFQRMFDGLRRFCQRFDGPCRLEVMLVRGVNDSPGSLAALAALARQLKIDGVDLNTVVRPPAHRAVALDAAQLQRAAEAFSGLDVQVIAAFSGSKETGQAPRHDEAPSPPARQRVLELLARRPCTAGDIAAGLGLSPEEAEALCAQALARGEVSRDERPLGIYYLARRDL